MEDSKNMEDRYAARAVLLDRSKQVAIINVGKYGYYKIPGGGVNPHEDILSATKREIKEETGCNAEITNELGRIESPLPGWKMNDISDGFLAYVTGEKGSPEFEDHERDRGFSVEWIENLDKAIQLIEANRQITDHEALTIQSRDLEFLKRAQDFLQSESAKDTIARQEEIASQQNSQADSKL